jgi:hypothetical protein
MCYKVNNISNKMHEYLRRLTVDILRFGSISLSYLGCNAREFELFYFLEVYRFLIWAAGTEYRV